MQFVLVLGCLLRVGGYSNVTLVFAIITMIITYN